MQMENHLTRQLVHTPGSQHSKNRSCRETTYARSGVVVKRPLNGLDEAGSDMPVGTVWPAAATPRPRALSGCLRKQSQTPRPGHVERKTIERVNCCDRERPNGAFGCRAPIEKADEFNRQQNGLEKAAQVLNKKLSGTLGRFKLGELR